MVVMVTMEDKDEQSCMSSPSSLLAATSASSITSKRERSDQKQYQNHHADEAAATASSVAYSTAALCTCSFLNAYLAISVFPYAGFMVLHLVGEHNDNNFITPDSIGTYAGLVSSSFMVGRTLSAFAWGRAADVYGRRLVLKAGLFLASLFSLLFGTATTLFWAQLWRFCLGLSNGGLIGVTKTAATELAKGDAATERRTIGLVIGMRSWGYLFSPAIGGLLSDPMKQYPQAMAWLHQGRISHFLIKYPFALPNLVACVGCCAALCIVTYHVDETLPEGKRRNSQRIPQDALRWIQDAWYQVLQSSCPCFARQRRGRHDEHLKLLQSSKSSAAPALYTSTTQDNSVPATCTNSELPSTPAPVTEKRVSIWGQHCTRRHLCVHWLFSFVSMCADEMFPLFCMSPTGGLGLTEASIGKVLSGAGLLFAISQYAVFSTLVHAFGEYKCLTVGSIFGIQPAVFIPLSLLLGNGSSSTAVHSLSWSVFSLLGVIMAVCKLFGMLYFASLTLALNRTVLASQRGTMNGLVVMGASMARSVAPTFAGALTAFCFSSTAFPAQYGSLLMYGTLSALGACVTLRVRRLQKWRDNNEAASVEMEGIISGA